jgi:hypothetical protein
VTPARRVTGIFRRRGSLIVWVTPEALEAWAPAKTGQLGRPSAYLDIAIQTAVMLRLAMGFGAISRCRGDHSAPIDRRAEWRGAVHLIKPSRRTKP